MRNLRTKLKTVLFLVSSLIFSGSCSTFSKLKSGQEWEVWPEVSLSAPVTLQLKSSVGHRDQVSVYSLSEISERSKAPKREEVFFELEQLGLGQTTEGLLSQQVRVLKKKGKGNLHDFAYPELGETFVYQLKKNGEVKNIKGLPVGTRRNSVFYLPSVFLVEAPVIKGDTWKAQVSWWDGKNSIEFSVDALLILKKFVKCGESSTCALLEFEWQVTSPTVSWGDNSNFLGRVWGKMLFSLDRGLVLFAEARSEDVVQFGKTLVETRSCMRSVVKNSEVGRRISARQDCLQQ